MSIRSKRARRARRRRCGPRVVYRAKLVSFSIDDGREKHWFEASDVTYSVEKTPSEERFQARAIDEDARAPQPVVVGTEVRGTYEATFTGELTPGPGLVQLFEIGMPPERRSN